jgi:hypothetical protein
MNETTHEQTPTPRPRSPEPPDDDDPARRLWSLWRQGQQPRVADFLEHAGVHDPEEIVMALRVDQAERRRLGQWVPAEDYLAAFPAVRDDPAATVDLVFAEYLLREGQGERLPLEEFLRRFPQHADELKLQIGLHREMDDHQPPTAAGPGSAATLAADGGTAPADRPTGYPDIHGYELLGVLGRGAMGIVYRARQTELKRPVALKMLIAGALASPEVAARYRVEVEAMARVRHPNIVQIHGVGQHAGAPFLVLELVEGRSLAQVLSGTPQPAEWSARTTEALARAIHAAHELGVVHRDLSPANVLLADDGTPKVTDFGLAKLIIGGGSLRTQTGDLLGTPSYMAPEQAEGSHRPIGAAADIYGLGAILYEMLTGRPPFKAEQPLETLRQVVHDEPVSPSRLRPRLPRDLETICLKCLQKEPPRRYASAEALADDLRRYLEGRPILARRSTSTERAWRWCQRNPTVAALTAVAAALTVLVAVVSSLAAWTYYRQNLQLTAAGAATLKAKDEAERALADTTKAKRATEQALDESEESRRRAEAAEKTARSEADKARSINKFLTADLLTQAEPAHSDAEDHVTLLEVLDRAADKVGDRFTGQPELGDALRQTIARTYHGLGSWEKAEQQWRAVLEAARRRRGPQSHEALRALGELAHMLRHSGRIDAEVLEMAKSAHEGLARLLGPDHLDTLDSGSNLADVYLDAGRTAEAITLHQATLKLCESKLGPDNRDALSSRNNLARAYLAAGHNAEAITVYQATLKLRESKLGPDHPDTLTSRTSLATAYLAAGRTAEAVRLLQATLKVEESKLGPDHPDTLSSRTSLASAYLAAGRTAEAITLHQATLKLYESKLGRDHPSTLNSRNNLATAYRAAGRTAEAITLHEATLKLRESKLGPDHPVTLSNRSNLAAAYLAVGRTAEAITLLEATHKLTESKLGSDHPRTLNSRNNLAGAYWRAGRLDRSIPLFESTLKQRMTKLGPDHPQTLVTQANLGVNYRDAGRPAEGARLIEEALEQARGRPAAMNALSAFPTALAAAYEALGQFAKAEPHYRQGLDYARKRFGPADLRTAVIMAQLGNDLLKQARWAEAEPVLRECLAIRETARPNDLDASYARSLLGGALLGQGKYAEAEPLIIGGYEGLKAREARIRPPGPLRLAEAAERVVRLYDAWGNPGQAAAWRAKLAKVQFQLPDDVFAPARPGQ